MSHDMHTAPSYGNDAGMDTGESMADAMNQMTSSLSAKEGDAFDKEFLKQMIVHHEGAVMMAKEALAKSRNKDILTLSTQIIEAQQAEIAEMKLWQKGKK